MANKRHKPEEIVLKLRQVDVLVRYGGLAVLVQSDLYQKPFDGSVYVFRAKIADRLKLINCEGSGLVMAYKKCTSKLLCAMRAITQINWLTPRYVDLER